MDSSLLNCPFCGATPHRGPTKMLTGQDGEPFQRYRVWCPHGHASFEEMTEAQAIAAWNRRAYLQASAPADVSGLVDFDGATMTPAAAANRLAELSATVARLTAERDEARQIVRDSHWMAVRYADGRKSYAPGMLNDALRKAYDGGWLTYRDDKQHDLDPQYARDGDKPEYLSVEARAEAAEAKVTALTEALERSGTALDDWLNIYASDLCAPERVAEAQQRIAQSGTIGYIADVQQQNRTALSHRGTE